MISMTSVLTVQNGAFVTGHIIYHHACIAQITFGVLLLAIIYTYLNHKGQTYYLIDKIVNT